MLKVLYKKDQNGQTVVITLILMILALSVGITLSSRYIKSLRNITESDDSSKALSIAEAAVERVLVLPTEVLDQYIQNNSCDAACQLEIVDTNGQHLTAQVELSHTGDSTEPYFIQLSDINTRELILTSYPSGQFVSVCWNGANSVTGHYVYSSGGKILATPYSYNSVSTLHPENNFEDAGAANGFQSCFNVPAQGTPLALRLKSVYGLVDAYVVPASGQVIPSQGVQIISTGRAGNAVKKVTVIKTSPYLPAVFDYAVYQKSDTDTLSN